MKTAAKQGLANLKQNAKQTALNTLTDTIGMDRVQIRNPNQLDEPAPDEDVMIDEQLPEDDGEVLDEQTGEGRRRRKKRSATLSNLLAGKGPNVKPQYPVVLCTCMVLVRSESRMLAKVRR